MSNRDTIARSGPLTTSREDMASRMPKSRADDQERRAEILARRLRTLLDIAEVTTGAKVTHGELAEHLAAHGLTLSRARWSYMVNGHRLVDDPGLLEEISAFFDVPSGYLCAGEPLPPASAQKLDLVRALRDDEVRAFATKMYAELAPEKLGAIIAAIDTPDGTTPTSVDSRVLELH